MRGSGKIPAYESCKLPGILAKNYDLNQSDCSMYSHDQYSTPARTHAATDTLAPTLSSTAERMGLGNVYDKQKDFVLSFVGHRYVLVLLPMVKR